MKVTVRELTTGGLTIHPSFRGLPFLRPEIDSGHLIKPILAYQTHSDVKIVGNIHTYEVALAQGKETVPVYLIEESNDTLELLSLIIEYYLPMNLMDKAILTNVALDLAVARRDIAQNILPLMDLAPREKLIDQLLFLRSMPQDLQTFIVDKDLSLKRALIFQRAEHHLDWVSQFIRNLKVGINMTAEIIQNIWEMAKKDEVDFKTKAEELGLWEMAETNYEDNRQAVMDIRNRLTKARFPILTQAGEELSEIIDQANLPKGTQVKWDPQFEERGVSISLQLKDEKELESALEKLSSNKFKQLFKKI